METTQKENWTKVIGSKTGWFDVDIAALWNYRDLIMLFVRRDFVSLYKQTILGPFWFLLQPLFSTAVYALIFGRIARIPTDGIPPVLFYMCGILIWNYFAGCLNKTSDTFLANAYIFSKVYFPRLTVPISIVISNFITFAIQFALFMAFWVYFDLKGANIHASNWALLLSPLLVFQMAALGLGLGILISSLTNKYRDLKYFLGFGIQLWMYATPIVYPMSQIPAKWHWIYALNPMAAIVETFRFVFIGSGTIRSMYLGMSLGITVIILFAGIVVFSRIEKTFMDTV
jgi:lipopolysaccharide transport system permease protein